MQKITEEQILDMAPNAAAASNGRKISQKGGFVRLECSADDTFYLGECTGSGKSNYITSVDFIDPEAPLCRCSCPSRQFPCKHGIGLLYEILSQKTFGTCEIPEDIIRKREKRQARNAGPEAGTADKSSEESKAAKKKAASTKTSKTAKTKKMKKQLEGLELAARLVQEFIKTGLGTMGGTSLGTYEELAKQLGDYYLPGPQRLLNGLIIEISAFQKDGNEKHYDCAIKILEKLWTLVKKSEKYLSDKLQQEDITLDDSELYEELGGVWKFDELEALGRRKESADLMQLSFWVSYDAARKEYVDTGCWADLETGEIFMTYNYRPVKALKYVKEDDSVFGIVHASPAVYYPGQGNLRIRWNGRKMRPVEQDDRKRLRSLAVTELAAEAKNVKNILKNALADPVQIRLISFDMIGRKGNTYVLQTGSGETIVLGNAPGMESSMDKIPLLPDSSLLKNQVLLGAFYYDASDRRLKLQPLSILTETGVVRLLY